MKEDGFPGHRIRAALFMPIPSRDWNKSPSLVRGKETWQAGDGTVSDPREIVVLLVRRTAHLSRRPCGTGESVRASRSVEVDLPPVDANGPTVQSALVKLDELIKAIQHVPRRVR